MRKSTLGFTLAELLISLAILGVIATFTIPRVITVTGDSRNKALAKDAAAMVSGAYSTFQLTNSATSATTGADLTQFMNYVNLDTTTDYSAGGSQLGTALQQCSATLPCLKLHNGGVLQYDTVMTLGGTTTTNAVYMNFDPDGAGVQGAITFIQYANGRLSTGQSAGTATPSGGSLSRIASDPAYLQSWD